MISKKDKTLYWELTDICQLRCRYCFYEAGGKKRKRKFFNLNDAITIIPDLSNSFSNIVITGGEPLLHPGILYILERLKKVNLNVTVITNGLYITKYFIDTFINCGGNSLSISLDSLDPELNSNIREPLSREPIIDSAKIIDNVKFLAKEYAKKINLTILQSINSQNFNKIPEMNEFAKEYNLRHLVHPIAISTKDGAKFGLELNNLKVNELDIFLRDFSIWARQKESYLRYFEIVRSFLTNKRDLSFHCDMGRTVFFMNVLGEIYPCFHITYFTYGNVMNGGLENINKFLRPVIIDKTGCANLACACMLEINPI